MDRNQTMDRVFGERDDGRTVNCVIRFDPRSPNLANIMHQHYDIMIEKDSRLKSVFPNCPRIAYTRPKNLKEVLSPTRLPKIKKKIDTRKPKPGFQSCPEKTCGMCPFTTNAADGNGLIKEVVIRHTGQVIPIKERGSTRASTSARRKGK